MPLNTWKKKSDKNESPPKKKWLTLYITIACGWVGFWSLYIIESNEVWATRLHRCIIFFLHSYIVMKKASHPPPPFANTKKPTLFQDFSSHFFFYQTKKTPKTKQSKSKRKRKQNNTIFKDKMPKLKYMHVDFTLCFIIINAFWSLSRAH